MLSGARWRVAEDPEIMAGWHRDPWGQAAFRWWDGTQWTALFQDEAPPRVLRGRLPMSIPFCYAPGYLDIGVETITTRRFFPLGGQQVVISRSSKGIVLAFESRFHTWLGYTSSPEIDGGAFIFRTAGRGLISALTAYGWPFEIGRSFGPSYRRAGPPHYYLPALPPPPARSVRDSQTG